MSEPRFSPGEHRADEIDWQTWGEDAFALARERDCPVLLSISGVWCHWCHVMDENAYSDPRIIQYINENLVPIRVDTDRRPEINARYNMGGWPTTAFLTPAGTLITGATYLPPDPLLGLMREVVRFYDANAEQMNKKTEKQVQRQKQQATTAPQQHPPFFDAEPIMEAISEQIDASYDRQFGGFGSPPAYEPKFPWLGALEFLVGSAERDDPSALHREMLHSTLDGMLQGEIFDSRRGGFFRYATRRDWSTPHFEKMGMDNAVLIEVYLRAAQALGKNRWHEAASKTLGWSEEHLLSDKGFFYGSQDADESYYQKGSSNVPQVDKTLYSDVNARMAAAHLTAFSVTRNEEYLRRGLKALQEAHQLCAHEDLGLFHYHDGSAPGNPGVLGDLVEFGLASLDAYSITAEEKYLRWADAMLRVMQDRLAAPAGGFFDSSPQKNQQVGRLRHRRLALDENCRAALFLHKIAVLSEKPRLHAEAEKCLMSTANHAAASGLAGALWLAIHRELYQPAPHVRLVLPVTENETDAEKGRQLLDAAREAPQRHAVVQVTRNRRVHAPQALVCRGAECLPPIDEHRRLKEVLQEPLASHRVPRPGSHPLH